MGIGNWKIGTRLGAGLGVAIIFMLGIAIVGIGNLGKLNNNTKDLAIDKVPKVILAYETIGGLNDIARAMRNAMLSKDPAVVKAELERVDKRKVEIGERLDQLRRLIADDDDPRSAAKLQAVLEARDKYSVVQTEFIKMSADAEQRDPSINYLLTTVRKEQTAYLNSLTELVKFQNAAVEDASTVAEQAYASSRNTMILLTVLAAGIAAWVLTIISRSITLPLNRAVGMAQAVAGGDLTMRMECHTTDETGQLLRALIDMNDSLARTVGQVRSGTDTIATASNEIASGNLDLSSRTEQQASSLEETASSMDCLLYTSPSPRDS